MSSFVAAVAEIKASLNDASVEFITGRASEGMNRQRRRVQLYRNGGTIEKPQKAGGQRSGLTEYESYYNRHESITAVIFAENEELTSALLDNLIHAIERAFPGYDSRFSDYEWAENEIAQRTPMIRFNFTLVFPSLPTNLQLTEIAAVNNVSEFDL